MWHCIEHALIDTLKVFIVVLLIYFGLSFIEGKIAKKFQKSSKYSPIIGAAIGLIPQCGFSIVASDLYKKRNITTGTLLAVFIACSDEALPILISSSDKILSIIPLFVTKFVLAISFGYLIDLILKRKTIVVKVKDHSHSLIHKGCCHHEIEDHEEESFAKKHIIHPLLHTLKICLYVLVVNIIFELLIYYIGESNIKDFLTNNVYLTPLFASLVGLIPNCASSVIISDLYISNILTFSATLAGLISNAGLGLVFLFKDKRIFKKALLITLTLFVIAIISGYLSLLIELSLIK